MPTAASRTAALFHKLTGTEPGVADGMKCDREGNVYCTGPGGIHVMDPDGTLLGRLRVPGHCTNLAWGDDDWRSLYLHHVSRRLSHPSQHSRRAGLVGASDGLAVRAGRGTL